MLIVKIELELIVLTPSFPPDCLQQKRSFAVLLAASPGKMEQATQQDRGSDVGRAEDIGLGTSQPVPLQVTVPESIKPSVPVLPNIALTDAQFERWLASQSLPSTVDRPVASTSHKAAHDMSDSGDSTGDGDPLPAFDTQGDAPVDAPNPADAFSALLATASSAAGPAQPDDDSYLDQLGLTWAACYAQEEAVGPKLNDQFAGLVKNYVRAKPADMCINSSLAKIAIPENCKSLVVPSLNPEVAVAMRNHNAKLTERVLARITGIVCKAMVPVLTVMSDVLSKTVVLPPDRQNALSESMALLSTVINVASQGRKNNIQNSIGEPLLRQVCGADTPVGETSLFDFNVCDKVAELKKAQRLGLDNKPKGFGAVRGKKHYHRYQPYHQFKPRGGYRGGGQHGGQYYAASGRGSQHFLSRGQRGRGRGRY